MDPDNQAILDAIHNQESRIRVRVLREITPEAWRSWREHFELVAAINAWNNQRQRQEIAVAMAGPARTATRGIPWGVVAADGVAIAPAADLLNALQARFIPVAAGQFAINAYDNARQAEGESPTTWHNRLRDLALQAEPGMDFENNARLRKNFINGLANASLAQEVANANPGTYAAALDEVVRRWSNNMAYKQRMGKGSTANLERQLYAMEPTEKDPGGIASLSRNSSRWNNRKRKAASAPPDSRFPDSEGCWGCGRSGHFLRECPHLGSTPRKASSPPSRGKPGSRGRGGGRGRGRGRGGRANNRSGRINHVGEDGEEEEYEDYADDEHEDEEVEQVPEESENC